MKPTNRRTDEWFQAATIIRRPTATVDAHTCTRCGRSGDVARRHWLSDGLVTSGYVCRDFHACDLRVNAMREAEASARVLGFALFCMVLVCLVALTTGFLYLLARAPAGTPWWNLGRIWAG
jgi:hypothetical protein